MEYKTCRYAENWDLHHATRHAHVLDEAAKICKNFERPHPPTFAGASECPRLSGLARRPDSLLCDGLKQESPSRLPRGTWVHRDSSLPRDLFPIRSNLRFSFNATTSPDGIRMQDGIVECGSVPRVTSCPCSMLLSPCLTMLFGLSVFGTGSYSGEIAHLPPRKLWNKSMIRASKARLAFMNVIGCRASRSHNRADNEVGMVVGEGNQRASGIAQNSSSSSISSQTNVWLSVGERLGIVLALASSKPLVPPVSSRVISLGKCECT